MTPKLISSGRSPIVRQILRQSATSWLCRNRTARGSAVVPEVNLRKSGSGSFHAISGESRRSIAFGRTMPCAWVTRRIFSSAELATSGSSGAIINLRSRQARNNAGHTGSLPNWTRSTEPAANDASLSRQLWRSASISANVRIDFPSSDRIATSEPRLSRTAGQKVEKLGSTCVNCTLCYSKRLST